MTELTFKNKYTTRPGEVRPLDAFAVKIVAWAHTTGWSWAAYYGPSDWTDEEVAKNGDELSENIAKGLFPVLAATGMLYGDV